MAPEGWKVGLLKRQVRSHLANERWKIARRRGTKHLSKSKCTSTPFSEHFWKLRCRKRAQRCGAKHMSMSKCTKHHMFAQLLNVRCRFAWCTLPKVSKTWGVCSTFKSVGRRGALKRICKDEFRVAGAVQETCSSEMLGGQGADFLRGVAFWGIRSSGLLRWFCVTGQVQHFVWLGTNFSWQAQYFRQMELKKIAKRIGTRPSALHSAIHFWRKSPRIASFLHLSTSKIEEVSQNSFAFDVVNFKNGGHLAELLRFLKLQSSKLEEFSQNFCVFNLADR